jgi:monosaccharide-transporting ATPase
MNNHQPVLQMEHISKEFPGVKALSSVNFRMFPGEVHALMGENGAGKSTLIKVLTGVYQHDSGTIYLDGTKIEVNSPHEAHGVGISTVYQEVNLCTNLSVAENIFTGREPMRFGRIDWKTINNKSKALLRRLNINIDVTKTLADYSVAIQQMVAIARALDIDAKVLILDEPTSSLDMYEVNQLFDVMRKLKDEGIAILFVTHFLDQVYEISDRITILRNGSLIGEYKTAELPRIDLVSNMIGKDLNELEVNHNRAPVDQELEGRKPLIQVNNGSRKGAIQSFDLKCYEGEVLGLSGLLGSGRTEIARILFGADRLDQGEIQIRGKKVVLKSPGHAISEGIAFLSENRRDEGIIGDLTIRENMILAMQGLRGWFKYIPMKRQVELADEYIKLLQVSPSNPEQLIKNLSGGNQQKVILGRWLLTDPDLLILDEPTRGIDVGTKSEIEKLVLKLSKEGKSVVFISSEQEEILRCSQRIAILRDRNKVKEMYNNGISQQEIMQAIAGGQET